jgi:hypothetical protein
MPHNFWMINCNEQNFDITRNLEFSSQGLKAEYRRKVQRVEPGDRIIYYVTGIRAFTATATVTRSYEEVGSSPWLREGKTTWPYRIGISPDVILEKPQYIEAGLLAYRLEYIRKWPPEDWHLAFQGNLHLLSKSDFFLLECEMLKLRDGRDKALLEIEARLAAEDERVNAQRERRRRVANRVGSRPPRARRADEPDPSPPPDHSPPPDAAETAKPQAAQPPGAPEDRVTANRRSKRSNASRGVNRQRARRTPSTQPTDTE